MSRSRSAARERGRTALLLVRLTTVGAFGLLALYAVAAVFVDGGLPAGPPAVAFTLATLVPLYAAVVFRRPAARVPECVWLTCASAVLLGAMGLGFGSFVAPVLGAVALVVVLTRPRGDDRAVSPVQHDDGPTLSEPRP